MAERRKSKSLKVVDLVKKFAGKKGKKAKQVAEAHKKAIGKKLGQPGFYKAVQEATGTGKAGKPRSAKARAAQEKKIKEESDKTYTHPLSSQDVSKIIAYAGKKGKKAAEEIYGKRVVKQAQRTISKRKPVTTGKEKTTTLGKGFQKADPNYYRTRQTTPELTGKDLKMSAGGKVMTGSQLVASLYD